MLLPAIKPSNLIREGRAERKSTKLLMVSARGKREDNFSIITGKVKGAARGKHTYPARYMEESKTLFYT
jgi:hypothetical protein